MFRKQYFYENKQGNSSALCKNEAFRKSFFGTPAVYSLLDALSEFECILVTAL